jgi:predicted alpha/beta superfamily hydrolase
VVGVGHTQARLVEYTPTFDASEMTGGGGDAYLAMLATELKPLVDAEFRTLPAPQDTAIVGSSLGGLISAYAGVKLPGTFGLLGVMSPSTWWDNLFIVGQVASTKGQPLQPLRVYLDSGDSGPSMDGVADTAQLAASYETAGFAKGKSLSYVVQAGASHNEVYWAQRLPGGLAFLLGPRGN